MSKCSDYVCGYKVKNTRPKLFGNEKFIWFCKLHFTAPMTASFNDVGYCECGFYEKVKE